MRKFNFFNETVPEKKPAEEKKKFSAYKTVLYRHNSIKEKIVKEHPEA